jgi:pilus assembly protein Flp/PilA
MTQSFIKKIKTFGADRKGVTMLEYGLIAALIAVVCITAITNIGTDINTKFQAVVTALGK